jgi:hypothetical protein
MRIQIAFAEICVTSTATQIHESKHKTAESKPLTVAVLRRVLR